MNKGQSEIMGFAMVMILISLGLIFFLVFSFNQEPSTLGQDVTVRQQTLLTNKAILDTTTTCQNIPIKKLLSDCATYGLRSCQTLGGTYVGSCKYLFGDEYDLGPVIIDDLNTPVGLIPSLLKQTLHEWGIDFSYKVILTKAAGDEEIAQVRNVNPIPRKKFTPTSMTISTDEGPLTMILGFYS